MAVSNQQNVTPEAAVVKQLLKKIRLEAFLWLATTVVTACAALYTIAFGGSLLEASGTYMGFEALEIGNYIVTAGVIALIFAAVNLILTINKFKCVKLANEAPIGISEKYGKGKCIGMLIYSIIGGGIIGIVAAALGFPTNNYIAQNQKILDVAPGYVGRPKRNTSSNLGGSLLFALAVICFVAAIVFVIWGGFAANLAMMFNVLFLVSMALAVTFLFVSLKN